MITTQFESAAGMDPTEDRNVEALGRLLGLLIRKFPNSLKEAGIVFMENSVIKGLISINRLRGFFSANSIE